MSRYLSVCEQLKVAVSPSVSSILSDSQVCVGATTVLVVVVAVVVVDVIITTPPPLPPPPATTSLSFSYDYLPIPPPPRPLSCCWALGIVETGPTHTWLHRQTHITRGIIPEAFLSDGDALAVKVPTTPPFSHTPLWKSTTFNSQREASDLSRQGGGHLDLPSKTH